jgi:cold shock CspA family protein
MATETVKWFNGASGYGLLSVGFQREHGHRGPRAKAVSVV